MASLKTEATRCYRLIFMKKTRILPAAASCWTSIFFAVSCALLPAFSVWASEERIDLQWTICDESGQVTASRLGIDPLVVKFSEVTYYDTSPPRYSDNGATFRTKYGKSKAGLVSIVKLRFSQTVSESDAECEWDRYGQAEQYTCEVEEEGVSYQNPWRQSQRIFIGTRLPVDWNSLLPYGPYPSESWRAEYHGWTLRLDSVNPPAPLPPLIELSVKTDYDQREEAHEAITQLLRRRGVPLCATQEPKTSRLFRAMGLLH